MRSHKLRYLLVGVVLFAMSWLGYWIGYISKSPGPNVYSLQRVPNKHTMKQHLDKKSKPSMQELQPMNIPLEMEKEIADHLLQFPVDGNSHFQNDRDAPLESVDDIHPVLGPMNPVVVGEEDDAVPPLESPPKPDGTFYTLMHSGQASRVPGNIHERHSSLFRDMDKDAYIFTSNSLPSDPLLRPSIGNGHLATMVHSRNVFMNSFYSGYRNHSHRAVIPSTCAFRIMETEPSTSFTRQYRLNTAEGMFSEVSRSATYNLTQRIYAHRTITRLLVVEIELEMADASLPLKLKVQLDRWRVSEDVTFTYEESGLDEVSYKRGRINAPEDKLGDNSAMTRVHILYDHVPEELVPPAGSRKTKWVFLSAVAQSKESAFGAYQKGQELLHQNDALYAQHVEAWAEVWRQGRIDVRGSLKVARAAYGSLYYLLSSMPLHEDQEWPFVGLSPSGLSSGAFEQHFQGHVLWDQEIWMSPPILFFYPDLAWQLLGARLRHMPKAAEAAKKIGATNGLKFPVESGFTGAEVSPRAHADRKVHVSTMISHAVMQYLYATNDTASLQAGLGQLLAGIGHYVVSQLIKDPKTGLYNIYNVATPDAPIPQSLQSSQLVNNSIFVQVSAKEALEAHSKAFMMVGKSLPLFEHFSEKVNIPLNSRDFSHPAYDSFTTKAKLRHPGGVYAGYPLYTPQSLQIRLKDLEMYQKVTSLTGPIMPWNMMLIGWLEVDRYMKAEDIFEKNFQYIQNDFQVWTETNVRAENLKHASNHLSGMGSFLQALIAGYGGFRYREDRLDFNPVLPPGVTGMLFAGVNYLGATLDFAVEEVTVLVRLTSQNRWSPALVLYVHEPSQVHRLGPGSLAVTVPRSASTLAASHVKMDTIWREHDL